MKRCAPYLLTLLLTLVTLSCAKEEGTNTVALARPLVGTNTSNTTPQTKASPQDKNTNSKLNNARTSPSPTSTPSTVTTNRAPNLGGRQAEQTSDASGDDYYINSKEVRVRRPVRSSTASPGATARCRDGTYSFSQSRRGTCSHHGGVAEWL